jgi:hypothetical protein
MLILFLGFFGVQAAPDVTTTTRGHLRGTSTTVAVTTIAESLGANPSSEATFDAIMEVAGVAATAAEPIGTNETSGAATLGAAMGDFGANATALRAFVSSADGTLGAASASKTPAAGCIANYAPCPEDPADCCSGYCDYHNGYSGPLAPVRKTTAHCI